jgi:hypothetical protein
MDWRFDLPKEYEKKNNECLRLFALIEHQEVIPIDYKKFTQIYEHIIEDEPPFSVCIREEQVQRLIELDRIADGLKRCPSPDKKDQSTVKLSRAGRF